MAINKNLINSNRIGTFGYGSINGSTATWITDLQSMSNLGMGWMRCNMDSWDTFQPTSAQNYDWSNMDTRVNLVLSYGMQFLATIPCQADWNKPVGALNTHWPTTDYTSVQLMCQAMATHFKGRITYYEVWNEPDNVNYWKPAIDATAYVAFLTAAYNGLKAGDPTCKVLIGGMAFPQITTWLDSFVSAGGLSFIDLFNIHVYEVYPDNNPLDIALSNVRARIGGMDMWITETSNTGGLFDVGDATPEHTKALWVQNIMTKAMCQPDVQVVIWHSLRTFDALFDGGLMTSAAVKLEAYDAMRAFNTNFNGFARGNTLINSTAHLHNFFYSGYQVNDPIIYSTWMDSSTANFVVAAGTLIKNKITLAGARQLFQKSAGESFPITTEGYYLDAIELGNTGRVVGRVLPIGRNNKKKKPQE